MCVPGGGPGWIDDRLPSSRFSGERTSVALLFISGLIGRYRGGQDCNDARFAFAMHGEVIAGLTCTA